MVGNYRAFVGKPEEYDRRGAVQFVVLTMLGLREQHSLLDIGCGSLRGGRLFIPYLLPGKYVGIEPAAEILKKGREAELGEGIMWAKRPLFFFNEEIPEILIGETFDFVLAQAVFCHLTISQIKTYLVAASKAMKPGAKFIASFHEAEIDDKRESLTYPEVAWYRMETMQRLAGLAGLDCRRLAPTLLAGSALHEQYARMTWVVMQWGAEG